jgi:surface carbohydrate biosynthesis protein
VIKTLTKIFFLSKLLKRFFFCRYQFVRNKKRDIILFDDEDIKSSLLILKNFKKKIFVLKTRSYALSTIYLSPFVIYHTLKNILNGNLNFSAYLSAVILDVNPKIVVTIHDNSFDFFNCAKILRKKMKFLAIQRAARYDLLHYPKNITKKIFIPEFLCFGDFERDLYKKISAKIEKFTIVGSAKYSLFEKKIRFKKLKKRFDLCLIGEIPHDQVNKKFNLNEAGGKLANFCHRFAEKHKLKIIIAGKRTKLNSKNKIKYKDIIKTCPYELEQKTYKKYIDGAFKLIPRNNFSTYKTAISSNVIIGAGSTVLRELLAVGKKILVCNFSNSSIGDFPIKGICFLKKSSYGTFEKRLLNIISLKKQEYFKKLSSNKNYLMHYSKSNPAYKIIEDRINSIL